MKRSNDFFFFFFDESAQCWIARASTLADADLLLLNALWLRVHSLNQLPCKKKKKEEIKKTRPVKGEFNITTTKLWGS